MACLKDFKERIFDEYLKVDRRFYIKMPVRIQKLLLLVTMPHIIGMIRNTSEKTI
jgi:hypothetical protein